MRENIYLSESPNTPAPVKLGISACLLGQKKRYDGSHQLDHYLTDNLVSFVEWVPVCPEVEVGLGVPREPMRLMGIADNPRLITRQTHIDHTEAMLSWAAGRIRELNKAGLCGFIFKSRSPSCGMQSVKIYKEEGVPDPVGSGIWARAFMDANPLLPADDEDRLRDTAIRGNFIERVIAFHQRRDLLA